LKKEESKGDRKEKGLGKEERENERKQKGFEERGKRG